MMKTPMQQLFDQIRITLCGGRLTQAQVESINAVLGACARHGISDARQRAYVLATAFHETAGRFQPVRETLAATDAEAISRLEHSYQAGKLPQVRVPYWRPDEKGRSWFGRGFVQLTHRRNYQALSAALGIDLTVDPGRALECDTAADILAVGMRDGLFSGTRLADVFNPTTCDWLGARRIVNGQDRADLVAGYGKAICGG
ncbi:glycoside hydrolase family 19 protein [Allorhizobium taibaishanense]|nr:glycoside hydrolase family 19 protein [Allorhizobium taibaishanense]MBB4007301.1 putative chitinase [Allorhizobium taibaishanense]